MSRLLNRFLTEHIRQEAKKLIVRHQRYASDLADEFRRSERRTGLYRTKVVKVPAHWSCDPGFDPYKVEKRAETVAYALHMALDKGTYRPRSAVEYNVPKPDGGLRTVSVFQIADNAISRVVFKALSQKNAPRLSGRCYAYRTDITIHDAVSYIASEFRSRARFYVAEFDFRKYFDSIDHEHLERLLRDRKFLITRLEMEIVRAFLQTPSLPLDRYEPLSRSRRPRGIPQGTSISLFLANVAASTLDRRLERLGIGFVRYADDTLIWSSEYGEICRAADALSETALEMGVELNLKKSEGISILANAEERTEFRAKPAVEYLGYSISSRCIGIRAKKVSEIKKRISYVIYANLLQPLRQGRVLPGRFAPSVDRDYLVMVRQVRRYLYGDVSEMRLRRYLAKSSPSIKFKGLLSFYPIVDDDELLRRLDGWLLHTVFTTLRCRTRVLTSVGFGALPVPHGLQPEALLSLWAVSRQGDKIDLRLPSFSRMARLLREAALSYGPNAIANPLSMQYYWD